jgi:hypothetical protein
MTNTVAAVTLALASTFAAGAADAHDHRHHHREHRGPDVYFNAPPPRYYSPPPVRYYAPPPPVYVQPRAARFEQYCTDTYYGSVRQNYDTYTGQWGRPRNSRQPCPY